MDEEKIEPIDIIYIKDEPPDAYPEFVERPAVCLHSTIKPRRFANMKIEHPLTLVEFNPAQCQTPGHSVNLQNKHLLPGNNQKISCKDLSQFWKAFKEQSKSPIVHQKINEITTPRLFHYGTHLLQTICMGHTQLKLPQGWNMFFIKDAEEISLLISQMNVEVGLPVMKRQVIITNSLKVVLFFGIHKITNHPLSSKGNKIRTVKCIQSIIESFSTLNWCKGVSPNLLVERWTSLITLDSYQNTDNIRHLKCQVVHELKSDQCKQCRYLDVRDRKWTLVKKRNYMTCSMIINYKYWRNMQMTIRKLRKRVKKLQNDKCSLRKRIKRLKMVSSYFLLIL